mgnify:CR=1 FL=1
MLIYKHTRPRPPRFYIIVSYVFCLMLSSVSATAQDNSSANAKEADKNKEYILPDPVSVTATRNLMEVFEYPGMVTVTGKKQMKLLQPSNTDDILKWVPNVEFTGGPRRTGQSPSIRGFSGPEVIITIDGARQNFDSGHDGRFFLDPSLLRGVEVLRGSASSLYGNGGTGGLISFRTVEANDLLAPGQTVGFSVTGGYQDVNEETNSTITLFSKPKPEIDLLAAVTKRDSGTIDLGSGEEIKNTDDDIISALVKGSWNFMPNHDLEFSFQRFHNNAEEPNNGNGMGSSGEVDKDIITDNYRVSYKFKDPANKLFDVDATFYATQFVADEVRLDSAGSGAVGELLKRDVDTVGYRIENRSRMTFGEDTQVTFTYGAEGYSDDQHGAAGTSTRAGVPDANGFFHGEFLQAEINLNSPLGIPGSVLLIPGFRYDSFNLSGDLSDDVEDDQFSPRIAASYFPTKWSLLFASYGSAFRAPTFNETYAGGVHFSVPISPWFTLVNRFVANPELKAQSTDTFEVGAGLDLKGLLYAKDQFKAKFSHFSIEGENFIDLTVASTTTKSVNVPYAKLWGTEIEASYTNSRVDIVFGYSTVDGKNKSTDAKLGVLTPGQFNVNTALKFPSIDSLLGWRFIAAEAFDKTDTESDKRPGYMVNDFYSSWQPTDGALKGLSLTLGVDNVFNKDYKRVQSAAFQPGRNFKMQVLYTYSF